MRMPARLDIANEDGATMISYVLLVVLIALVSVGFIGYGGRAVSDTFTDVAAQASPPAPEPEPEPEPEPDYPTETAGVDGKAEATFVVRDGVMELKDVDADGWNYRITKQTDRRINVRFTNPDTGEVIRVNGWLNKKDVLKTKVRA